jgi:transposase
LSPARGLNECLAYLREGDAQDLRERVFAAADDGAMVTQIARLLRVSVSYVSKVLSRRRRTGQTQALPQRCHVPPKLAGLHSAIQAQVAARPDATIAELRAWLPKTHQISASTGLMCKTLAVLDLTYKKKSFGRASKAVLTSPRLASNGVRSSRT